MSKTYADGTVCTATSIEMNNPPPVPSWDEIERESRLCAAGPKLDALLRALIRQIEMGDYTDAVGHKLTSNVHFIAAKEAT